MFLSAHTHKMPHLHFHLSLSVQAQAEHKHEQQGHPHPDHNSGRIRMEWNGIESRRRRGRTLNTVYCCSSNETLQIPRESSSAPSTHSSSSSRCHCGLHSGLFSSSSGMANREQRGRVLNFHSNTSRRRTDTVFASLRRKYKRDDKEGGGGRQLFSRGRDVTKRETLERGAKMARSGKKKRKKKVH